MILNLAMFGDTVCFVHCRILADFVEYICNNIRMDVGAVDCILWLPVQFLSEIFTHV